MMYERLIDGFIDWLMVYEWWIYGEWIDDDWWLEYGWNVNEWWFNNGLIVDGWKMDDLLMNG
jgi:hypothetical protein